MTSPISLASWNVISLLGDSSGGHVQVEAPLGEHRRIDTQFLGVGSDIAQGYLRRFLHDLAQLT